MDPGRLADLRTLLDPADGTVDPSFGYPLQSYVRELLAAHDHHAAQAEAAVLAEIGVALVAMDATGVGIGAVRQTARSKLADASHRPSSLLDELDRLAWERDDARRLYCVERSFSHPGREARARGWSYLYPFGESDRQPAKDDADVTT